MFNKKSFPLSFSTVKNQLSWVALSPKYAAPSGCHPHQIERSRFRLFSGKPAAQVETFSVWLCFVSLCFYHMGTVQEIIQPYYPLIGILSLDHAFVQNYFLQVLNFYGRNFPCSKLKSSQQKCYLTFWHSDILTQGSCSGVHGSTAGMQKV